MSQLTPRQIVAALDQHIVGQQAAKRAVAIALRNRWRRQQLDPTLRAEVTPKNILMIGPTGVGKTEIARRLAALADAPFVKVEATRFTEVGYVGRDVEAIARDLADVAYQMVAAKAKQQHAAAADKAAEERILDALLPRRRNMGFIDEPTATDSEESATREKLRAQLRSGALDEREIEIEHARLPGGIDVLAPAGMEQLQEQLKQMFKQLGAAQKQTRKLRIAQARSVLADEEAAKRLNEDELRAQAIELAEQHGIVFIDEIDKVVQRSEWGGAGVSREGVQRDLLPLVEGTQVTTKYGALRTDHVLFIASGAFQLTRPADLIPELQGRLPIRVELKPLTVDDLIRILTEPNAALTRQYQALLATEGVRLEFSPDAIRRIAEVAQQLNLQQENIGARRLSTVLERLLEEISYSAGDEPSRQILLSAADVDQALGPIAADQDLARYVL